MDDDGNFDYLAGVEVSGFSELPAEFARLRIPAQRYAIFTHREHVSTIHDVGMTIWTKWLPGSGYEAVDAPFFEYYGEEFDGRTGMGGFQMWIPIKTQPRFSPEMSPAPGAQPSPSFEGRLLTLTTRSKADLKGQLRVELISSPSRREMPAICATAPFADQCRKVR